MVRNLVRCVAMLIIAVVVGAGATGDADAQALEEYRLGAGDRVKIDVFGQEDLSGDFEVDSLGRLSLPLLGEIDANNRTVAELQTLIVDGLNKDFIVDPRVSIQVVNYRPFFILGQVNKPGSYPFIAGMTVRQAIAIAGGFTRRAREEPVTVIHANDPEQTENDALLRDLVLPGDTIDVRRRLF